MITTEAEAKTKWCPFAPSRSIDDERSVACVASGCMAWRWVLTEEDAREASCKATGYCGLAGNPTVKVPF